MPNENHIKRPHHQHDVWDIGAGKELRRYEGAAGQGVWQQEDELDSSGARF